MVSEPKGTGEAFDNVMKDFYSAVKKGKGALFMAVCRGKVCDMFLDPAIFNDMEWTGVTAWDILNNCP